ncbi:PilX N-terminal domain-containing pilus assembly protein [Nevskia sp.]|uniref:pilus assembly PilX family protein n=1 Tax=Nevskia sp. TaxID=1929292 RepID=UPI0025DA3336|nr:PilX N-terminal domain-containing pilus assembly protein [Nevskia sp.]
MNAPRAQQGVVLLIGLIILLLLSLLAIGSIRSTTLEERMTGNSQDQQIAFQVAEAALREAEMMLGQPMLPPFVDVGDANADGFYLPDPPNGDAPDTVYRPLWLRTAADARNPVWRAASVTTDAPPAPIDRARGDYLIEQLDMQEEASPGESLQADSAEDRRERVIYRITARAWGAATADQAAPAVLLQSTFKR